MSTNAELKARLARLGQIRDAAPPPLFSGELVTLILRRDGKYEQRISVLRRLRAAGLTLQAAHAVITRLAEADLAVCRVAEGADIPALARDLAPLDVRVYRRRSLAPSVIGEVLYAARPVAAGVWRNARHRREYAAELGTRPQQTGRGGSQPYNCVRQIARTDPACGVRTGCLNAAPMNVVFGSINLDPCPRSRATESLSLDHVMAAHHLNAT